MSTKKYLDDDGLLYVKQKLDTKFADKVDKVTGKGLSTEDYTTAEKTKLSGIETGAEENVIESVKVNGTALTPDANKAVDVTVPTKTSDLTNDSDYTTNDLIVVGDDSDVTANTKLLIEEDEPDIVSEVVNTLEGDEINKSPSVHSLKEAITIVSSTEPTGNDRKKVWKQHSKNRINLPNGTYETTEITAVVNNGIITINGTATATRFVRIPLIETIDLKANTNYVFSAHNVEIVGTESTYAAIRFNTGSSDDSTTDVGLGTTNANKVLNYEDEKKYNSFVIRVGSGIAFNNFVIKPQLEQNSSVTTFETYIQDKEYILANDVYEKFSADDDNKVNYLKKRR